MELKDFINKMNSGEEVESNSETMAFMQKLSQEALKITMEINNKYHTPDELNILLKKLTGDENLNNASLFPPFYTDCGKNTHFGKNIFINSGCRF